MIHDSFGGPLQLGVVLVLYRFHTNIVVIQTYLCMLLLLLLGVDVYHLGMSRSRPLSAPSTTVSSLAMSLVAARHTANLDQPRLLIKPQWVSYVTVCKYCFNQAICSVVCLTAF